MSGSEQLQEIFPGAVVHAHASVHGCKFWSNWEYFKADEASLEVVITANDVFLVKNLHRGGKEEFHRLKEAAT